LLLEVEQVRKQYGSRAALRGISFRLEPGESVGYLGPNGAGKSTTLKLLAGLDRPSSGTVRVHGHDPDRDRGLALAHVGALVETPGLPPYLHGRDLLDYAARSRSLSAPERAPAVRRAADELSVGEHLDRPFGSLSTGLARRILLAAALVGEPDLLLLDEPTLGLDPVARADLRKLLRLLAGRGVTLLLSTHLLEDVTEVCGRVLFLREGAVVGDEPVDLGVGGRGPGSSRALRFEFEQPIPPEGLSRLASVVESVTVETPRQVLVRFTGGLSEQAELVDAAVRAGLRPVAVSAPEPDLARRYLEKVGREEGP
jgi:ABC-2 type transport system ATP-binding protein